MSSFQLMMPSSLKLYARDIIISIARFLPNSFKFFSIPSRRIESYKDLNYIKIYPKVFSKRALPKTIHTEDLNIRFQTKLDYYSSETFVLCLDRGISTNIGANLTKSGRLIKEVSKEFSLTKIENHQIFKSPKFLPKIKKYNCSVATLTTTGQSNYFHWLFDVLPKIHLIEKSGLKFDKIYVPVRNKFQEESLKALGYESEQLINSNEWSFISASQLIIPSQPNDISSNVPAWACNFLRDNFLKYIEQELEEVENKLKKIYICRGDAKYRRTINEAEVTEFLNKYGFSVVRPERMSFLSQVKLFRDAEVIVAPHGAGLSNIVFCRNKAKLIEIFAPKFVNLNYYFISQQIGIDYYYLIGEGEKIATGLERKSLTDDIEVDIDKLQKTLELAAI